MIYNIRIYDGFWTCIPGFHKSIVFWRRRCSSYTRGRRMLQYVYQQNHVFTCPLFTHLKIVAKKMFLRLLGGLTNLSVQRDPACFLAGFKCYSTQHYTVVIEAIDKCGCPPRYSSKTFSVR